MVDCNQQPALGYMKIVDDRSSNTLLPIIQARVKPGTDIRSDYWSAYGGVSRLPNVSTHQTVNHSQNFVDPMTGVHTQNIESYWARVKLKFKRMKGVDSKQLPSYLDEFMWRERYAQTTAAGIDNLFMHISEIYPV